VLSLKGALALYGLCLATLLVVGGALGVYGILGLAAAEWLCVGLPTIAAMAIGPERAATALGLRRPRAAAWAGALLVGASGWVVVGLGIAPLLERLAPMPKSLVDALERAANPDGAPLWLTLLAVAVTPAICEELLCRGALLPPLRERFGPRVAVLLAAVLFAALHLSPYRFVPTLLLGVVFGTVAVASGSTLPAMLAHALNNSAVIALASDEARPLREGLERHALAAVGGAVVVLTFGLWLVYSRGRR
jgi:sodium transport system permease protein